jgi:hypothetical protein
MDRIYAFLVKANANESNQKHPVGTPCTLLAFCRQEEREPNVALCEAIVRSAGWSQIVIQGSSLATVESVKKMQKTPDPAITSAYAEAQRNGFKIVVFSGG